VIGAMVVSPGTKGEPQELPKSLPTLSKHTDNTNHLRITRTLSEGITIHKFMTEIFFEEKNSI
jgi:hypothetical protein